MVLLVGWRHLVCRGGVELGLVLAFDKVNPLQLIML